LKKKQTGHCFQAVDTHDDPGSLVRALDTLHREPFYAAYKIRIVELMNPQQGNMYLEVGAGTGDDARALAEIGRSIVVAVDMSRTMTAEASSRGLRTVVAGDAEYLPFAEDTFDGCWADRTFQHLSNPGRALDEIIRVTKVGGRVVVVDPDYDTQVVECPDQELARRVLRFRTDRGLRNGALAHRMPAMFGRAGLSNIETEPLMLVVRDPTSVDNVMGLRSWARSAQLAGYLSVEDADRWEQLFDETAVAGCFLYALAFFITAGTK
jgi:SAM-dependent methyltransferase